ncbi:MAG: hypothetical protein FWG31_07760 [Oscillospiraceae bacterium]|nr:hypothetical protein [Oscillospiraceae bacterium]
MEILLIVLCIIASGRFRRAGEKGAGKYIGGIWGTWGGSILLASMIGSATGSIGAIYAVVFICYAVEIGIAVSMMKAGQGYLDYRETQKLIEEKKAQDSREKKLEAEMASLRQQVAVMQSGTQPSRVTTPTVNVSKQDYYALADKLAHYHTFSMDESEADQMELELLAGGNDALTNILQYLLHCGQGKQSQGWWSNSKRLVRLIRRFPGEDHANILTQLVNYPSNIWEYQEQVKNVAEEELKGRLS